MQHDEFIGKVQHYARLSSRGDAERTTRVVLETLAERLSGGEAENLAAQLPQEIGRHLLQAGGFERLSLHEFFERVSDREGSDLPDAVHHVRAVCQVLREAVSPDLIEHVQAQLPEDFDRLFEVGAEGQWQAP